MPRTNMVLDEKNLFVNPYNFVSLSDTKPDRNPIGHQKRELTGYLDCSMQVAEMVALPDKNEADPAHPNCYGFYQVNGRPVIPGSEIRGCIRSIFEAATNSCFLTTDDALLSARLPVPKNSIRSGLIRKEKGIWTLYRVDYRDKDRKKLQSGKIHRKWRTTNDPAPADMYSDLLQKVSVTVPDKIIDKLRDTFALYQENNDKEIRAIEKNLKEAKEEDKEALLKELEAYKDFQTEIETQTEHLENGNGDVFVFYELTASSEFSYISPAAVGRQVFDHTVYDLLAEHRPCTKDKYCPACALFGTLGNGNSGSQVASRIRFDDALSDDAIILPDYLELPELSSPKLSNMEFYAWLKTSSNNAVDRWTYDSNDVQIRGRKFYFHSTPQYQKPDDPGFIGQRSMAVKPCTKGIFDFRIYFDKISETELKQLCWVVSLGENQSNGKQMHKIGAGRSVGFGSVKMIVNNVTIRTFKDGRYVMDKEAYQADVLIAQAIDFLDKTAIKDLKSITDYHFLDGFKVSYPIGDNGTDDEDHDAGYQWFIGNRQGVKKFEQDRFPSGFKYMQVLPKMSDDPKDLTLKAVKGEPQPKRKSYQETPFRNEFATSKMNEEKVRVTCSVCGKPCWIRKSLYEKLGDRVKCWDCLYNK